MPVSNSEPTTTPCSVVMKRRAWARGEPRKLRKAENDETFFVSTCSFGSPAGMAFSASSGTSVAGVAAPSMRGSGYPSASKFLISTPLRMYSIAVCFSMTSRRIKKSTATGGCQLGTGKRKGRTEAQREDEHRFIAQSFVQHSPDGRSDETTDRHPREDPAKHRPCLLRRD